MVQKECGLGSEVDGGKAKERERDRQTDRQTRRRERNCTDSFVFRGFRGKSQGKISIEYSSAF